MKQHKLNTLSDELLSVGAGTDEARELSRLALALGELKYTRAEQTSAFSSLKKSRRVWLPAVTAGIIGAALGMILITLAQTSLPGAPLYPLKRASEGVAVSVQSNYRGTIMMRRAQEVQALVNQHANQELVLGTLADYRLDAQAYEQTSAHYSLFEYCKSSLQQAEAQATASEREAIQQTLDTLRDS